MFPFIVRRFALTLPVLWVVVTLVFCLIHLVPGDPVAQMLGEGAPATQIEDMRHQLGLDRTIFEQYRSYLFGLLSGDLGKSYRFQEPVTRSIAVRYPATLELGVAATLFSI